MWQLSRTDLGRLTETPYCLYGVGMPSKEKQQKFIEFFKLLLVTD